MAQTNQIHSIVLHPTPSTEPPESGEVDWEIEAAVERPEDGALVRRWFRCWYDVDNRIQHTEDRYEIIEGGKIVRAETYVGSPYLTWYGVDEALQMLRDAGFAGVHAHADFRFEPAAPDETSYIVLATRP